MIQQTQQKLNFYYFHISYFWHKTLNKTKINLQLTKQLKGQCHEILNTFFIKKFPPTP